MASKKDPAGKAGGSGSNPAPTPAEESTENIPQGPEFLAPLAGRQQGERSAVTGTSERELLDNFFPPHPSHSLEGMPEGLNNLPENIKRMFPPECWPQPRNVRTMSSAKLFRQISWSQYATSLFADKRNAWIEPMTADRILQYIMELHEQALDQESYQVPQALAMDDPQVSLMMYLQGYFKHVSKEGVDLQDQGLCVYIWSKFKVARREIDSREKAVSASVAEPREAAKQEAAKLSSRESGARASWKDKCICRDDPPESERSTASGSEKNEGEGSNTAGQGFGRASMGLAKTARAQDEGERGSTSLGGREQRREEGWNRASEGPIDEVHAYAFRYLEKDNTEQKAVLAELARAYDRARGRPTSDGRCITDAKKRFNDSAKFDGKPESDVTITLRAMGALLDEADTIPQREAISLIPLFLKDSAYTAYWRDYQPKANGNFLVACAWLLRDYYSAARQDLLYHRYQQATYADCMDEYKTLADFAEHLRQLAPACTPERLLVDRFLEAIPSDIAMSVRRHGDPRTLTSAATEAEKQQQLQTKSERTHGMTTRSIARSRHPAGASKMNSVESDRHGSVLADDDDEFEIDAIRGPCHACHQEGHVWARCPRTESEVCPSPEGLTGRGGGEPEAVDEPKDPCSSPAECTSTSAGSRQALLLTVVSPQLKGEITALVDTGATSRNWNLVKKSVLQEPESIRTSQETESIRVVNASGYPMQILGTVTLEAAIAGRPVDLPCLVVERCSQELILSMAFLGRYISKIDISEGRMEWNAVGTASEEPPVLETVVEWSCTLVSMNGAEEEEETQLSPGLPEQPDHLETIQETINRIRALELPHVHGIRARRLKDVLEKHAEVFRDALGQMKVPPCRITLKAGATPKYHRPYALGPEERKAERDLLEQGKREGIFREGQSEWGAPNVLVRKKDGSYRLCTNFRALNQCIELDKYPLPLVDIVLNELAGRNLFSKMDLKRGFFQIPVAEECQPLLAIASYYGTYLYQVLPMGLTNAPGIFQRAMNYILSGLLYHCVHVFMDDSIVSSAPETDHIEKLDQVLAKYESHGVKVNLEKCEFLAPELEFLGTLLNEEGKRPSPKFIAKVQAFPETLNTTTQIQILLGLATFVRKYITQFTTLVRPLRELLIGFTCNNRKRYKNDTINTHGISHLWTEAHSECVRRIKEALVTAPLLKHPDPGRPYRIETDASEYQLGAVLMQFHDETWHPVAYESRTLSAAEKNYSATEREALAIVWSLGVWRSLVLGCAIEVVTDHAALTWLFGSMSVPARAHTRVVRWGLVLDQFQLKFKYRPGAENHMADALSRLPLIQLQDGSPDSQELAALDSTDEEESGAEDDSEDEEESEGEPGDSEKWKQHLKVLWARAVREDLHYKHQLDGAAKEPSRPPRVEVYRQGEWLIRRELVGSKRAVKDLVLVPKHKELRLQVIRLVHEEALHPGSPVTYQRVKQHFWWIGMQNDVRDVLDSCSVCRRDKWPRQEQKQVELAPIQTTQRFELVCIDLFKVGVTSTQGHKYILTMVDHFTKYVEITPLKSKESLEVVNAVLDFWVFRFGPPWRLHSDGGKEFVNKLLVGAARVLGFALSTTTPYHPQGNGAVERVHRSLKRMLRVAVGPAHERWNEKMARIAYVYNSARHETTGYPPYTLMFGTTCPDIHTFIPGQPAMEVVSSRAIEPGESRRWERKMIKELRETQSIVWRRASAARAKFKRTYDARVGRIPEGERPKYEEGSRVWLWTPARSSKHRSGKLSSPWTGPFVVERMLNRYSMLVRDEATGQVVRCHTNRLRKADRNEPVRKDKAASSPTGAWNQDLDLPETIGSSYLVLDRVLQQQRAATGDMQYLIQVREGEDVRREWFEQSKLPDWVGQDLRAFFKS